MFFQQASLQPDELPADEAGLQELVDEAQELFLDYENGLPIRISLVSAYARGEGAAWWGGLQREWWPLRGIVVQRSYKSKRTPQPPDTESFSLGAIVAAQRPDVDYVGLVDSFRRKIILWNKLLGWTWILRLPVPDFWGTAIVRSEKGIETVLLEHMINPLAGFDYIVECSEIMLQGLKAYDKLKKMRAEKKAAPSFEQRVDAEARFRLAVEKRLAELHAQGGG